MKVICTKSDNDLWTVGETYNATNEGSGYMSIGHTDDHNAGYNLVLIGYDNKLAIFNIPLTNIEFTESAL